jgi:hypothetical protein
MARVLETTDLPTRLDWRSSTETYWRPSLPLDLTREMNMTTIVYSFIEPRQCLFELFVNIFCLQFEIIEILITSIISMDY